MDGGQRIGIVFTNVDGTLVGADHHPILSTAPIMGRVAERVPICLVSARSPEGLTPIHRQLGFTGPIACYSGADVLDENGDELLSETIDTGEAVAIKEHLRREYPGLTIATYGFHDWIVDDRSDPRIVTEERLVQATSRQCSDIAGTFGDRGVHKLLLMGAPEDVYAAQSTFSELYPHLNVVRSSDILCEVMCNRASKSCAVRILCEHCGVDPSCAVAFGDGPNDLDMLAAVDQSYAMAYAEEEVKARAAHQVPWTNEEGGVARMLERLVLDEQ